MPDIQHGFLGNAHQTEIVYWIIALALVLATCAYLPWLYRYLKANSPRSVSPDLISPAGAPEPKRTAHRYLRALHYPFLPSIILFIIAWIQQKSLPASHLSTAIFISLVLIGAAAPLFHRSCRTAGAATGLLLIALMQLIIPREVLVDQIARGIAPVFGIEPGVTVVKHQTVHFDQPVLRTTASTLEFSKDRTPYFRSDYFSLEITGCLDIEYQGEYQFYLISDDGADLEIDGKTVLSNPGFHAAEEVSAAIVLETGCHPFRIPYYNGASDAVLRLEWAPPHHPRSAISPWNLFINTPNRLRSWIFRRCIGWGVLFACLALGGFAFYLLRPHLRFGDFKLMRIGSGFEKQVRTESPRELLRAHRRILMFGLAAGIAAVTGLWTWFYLPRFSPLKHGLKGTVYSAGDFDTPLQSFEGGNARMHSISHRHLKRNAFWAVFEGYLKTDRSGVYRFSLQADDGSRLKIDHAPVLNAWDIDPRRVSKQTRHLEAGLHHIRVEMHSENQPAFIDLKYIPPGSIQARPINVQHLFPEKPSDLQIRNDRIFSIFRISLFAISILLCLGFSIHVLRSSRRSDIRPWLLSAMLYPVTSFILVQSIWMDPDYRFGFEWFLRCSASVRLIILGLLFLLFLPPVRLWITRLPSQFFLFRSARITAFFASIMLGFIGQMFFSGPLERKPTLGVICFAFAALGVLASYVRIDPDTGIEKAERSEPLPEADPAGRIVGMTLFVLILFAAAFLRFFRLHELPPGLWWDEAQTGIAARDILNGHLPPVYDLKINAGSLLSFGIAGWFSIFGSSILALRAYYATVGVITTGVSFFFFRTFFPPVWSLFGMTLIAISRWLFSINRVAMATIDETILLTFTVFIVYIAALRSGRMWRYLLCGVLVGIGLHLHTGARVLPLIIGVDLVTRLIRSPRVLLLRHLKLASILVTAAILAFAPMALHIIRHPSDYFKRSKETLLSTEYPGYYSVPTLAENTLNYMKMYSYSGDWHPRHNHARAPQLAPPISVLALFGLTIALSRWRRDIDRFFILGFLLVSLQGILTVHNNTANLNRVAENIPIVHFWAVCGMVYIADGLARFMSPRHYRRLVGTLTGLILMISVAFEYHLYFNLYSKSREIVGVFGFQPELTEPAEVIRDLLDHDETLRVFAEYTRSDSFRYVLPAHPRLFEIMNGRLPDQLPEGSLAIVVLDQNHSLDRDVRHRFPDAIVDERDYSLIPGYTLYRIYRIQS